MNIIDSDCSQDDMKINSNFNFDNLHKIVEQSSPSESDSDSKSSSLRKLSSSSDESKKDQKESLK